jgi:hypothetical protein
MKLSRLLVTLLLICGVSAHGYAAGSPAQSPKEISDIAASSVYRVPDEHSIEPRLRNLPPRHPLGRRMLSLSPGKTIGTTWYDCQQIGSMGRMIDWSRHGAPDTLLVHFTWTYMPYPFFFARQYRYNNWNAAAGTFGTETGLQPEDDFGGFVGIDATNNGRAVIGGHNWEGNDGFLDCHFYWDSAAGASSFTAEAQVPRALAEYGGPSGQEVIWPKFRYQEGAGDTILHVLAVAIQENASEPVGLYYFRKVGMDASGVWDDPPYIVDTVYNVAHDLDAADNGKVVLAWIANLPCPGDPCDTCSGTGCWNYPQWDNDLYYQVSTDGGATWQPRVNITQNVDGEDGYRPYTDLSALITTDGNVHIVWGARWWPADANQGGAAGLLRGRIFHWSEDQQYVRTVHNFEWDQTTCNGGAFQLNAAKMTVAECDGKLYVLFVQFNDVPNGIEDDCAAAYNPGFPKGAANGELYLTISADGGLTWDKARNLTNSRTPGCDSLGGLGGPCDSDHWPSMTRRGTDYSGDFSGAEIVVPAGSTDPGTFYLDVQYINDHSTGAIVQDEGFWSEAEVKWFRLPCVEPIMQPQLTLSPTAITYPTWTKHGMQLDTPLTITNNGNATLSYSITVEESNGPDGWLGVSGFSGTVPYGLNNSETGTISLNVGGKVNNPGTIVNLVGRLIFTSNAPTSPDTFPVSFHVADTLYPPVWDTIWTACIGLTTASNGNAGMLGIGGVNLDYTVLGGDCDSTASVYLYESSPVAGWVKGNDTIVNYSMYNGSLGGETSFLAVDNHAPAQDSGDYEVFRSGVFVTNDATIALEKIWYSPQQPDSCRFVIECLRVYSYDGLPHTGLTIGAAVDWDIPSDSNADNGSGFDLSRNLIYQIGGEYNQDDSTECQENDTRFGGVMFLECFLVNDSIALGDSALTVPHGAYTRDNATYVYPGGGFIPGELYANMQDSGYSLYSSSHPDSQLTDLHTVMTFATDVTLGAGDTLIYFTSLMTVMNGTLTELQQAADESYQWYQEHIRVVPTGCCLPPTRGNVNYDSEDQVNVADLTYLVDFLFAGGAPPPCWSEGNVDGDTDEMVNVADLTYLVDFLFKGGPLPAACP